MQRFSELFTELNIIEKRKEKGNYLKNKIKRFNSKLQAYEVYIYIYRSCRAALLTEIGNFYFYYPVLLLRTDSK